MVNKKNNSVTNLLKLLRSLNLVSSFYSIRIIKNIPVFGGLGGGSSNSAYTLKFLLKNRVTKNLLSKVEKKIGSDIRLFFYKRGFLKNLTTIIDYKKRKKLFFLLVQPKIKCSTKEIFQVLIDFKRNHL